MERDQQTIGIDAITYSIPKAYVALPDLAAARGIPAAKYTSGLGTLEMAVASPEEDPVTLAVNAARRLFQLSGRAPAEIGLCIVGTETAVDHSKPIASYLHGLLGLPRTCRVFETKHACFGGTAGLLAAVDWIAAGQAHGLKSAQRKPRVALVICSDIARYPLGSAGEPTQVDWCTQAGGQRIGQGAVLALRHVLRDRRAHPVAGNDEGAGIRRQAAGERGEQRGLASAVAPDHAHARARVQGQVDVGQQQAFAAPEREVAEGDHGGVGDSGVGLTLSTYGIQTFTRPKAWHLRKA